MDLLEKASLGISGMTIEELASEGYFDDELGAYSL